MTRWWLAVPLFIAFCGACCCRFKGGAAYLCGRAALPNNAGGRVMAPGGCACLRFILTLKPLSPVHKAGAVVTGQHHYPPATHQHLHAVEVCLFCQRLRQLRRGCNKLFIVRRGLYFTSCASLPKRRHALKVQNHAVLCL